MDDKEKELRSAIATNLGDIIEGILTKNPKYNDIPVHQEASQTFSKYCEYENKLKSDLKSRFLLAEITAGRFFCETKLFGYHGKPFSERYPEHIKARKDFWDWIKSYEGLSCFPIRARKAPIKKAEVNKCVKQMIKNRHPDFKIDNKAFGSIGYSKKLGQNNKIYIVADTGSWRTTLTFMLGVNHPNFCMDVAEFFADSQSHYGIGYESIKKVEKATNRALDLVDALMPHYLGAIESAFTENGSQI